MPANEPTLDECEQRLNAQASRFKNITGFTVTASDLGNGISVLAHVSDKISASRFMRDDATARAFSSFVWADPIQPAEHRPEVIKDDMVGNLLKFSTVKALDATLRAVEQKSMQAPAPATRS